MTALKFNVRKAIRTDHGFIYAAIAYIYENPRGAAYYGQVWNKSGLINITYILEATVDGETTNVGFYTAARDILVFIYIKPVYRQLGLANVILKHAGLDGTYSRKRYAIKRGQYQYITHKRGWVVDALSIVEAVCDIKQPAPGRPRTSPQADTHPGFKEDLP
jgi:hypothetical protein